MTTAIIITATLFAASALVGLALLKSPAVPDFTAEETDATDPTTRAYIDSLWDVR